MSGDLVKESRVSFCWPASAFSCKGSLIFAHTYWQIISWPPQSHYLFLCILSFYLKESKSLNIVFVKFRHELNTNNTKICEGTMKKLWEMWYILPCYINSGQRQFIAEENSEKNSNLAEVIILKSIYSRNLS